MVTERRQSPRSKPFGLIYLNLASDNGGIVLDASEDGLQFQAVAPVTHDDGPMPLWFTLNPTNRIETVGEIVWTDETRKTGGLRFTNLQEETRLQIRNWLEQNGSPLPVREYASPIDLALSESTFVEEAEHLQKSETIRKPRASEIEVVLNSVESEIAPPARPAATIVPLYPEPRPEFKESDAPAVTAREAVRSVEPAPAIPQRVPRVTEPRPAVIRRDIPRDTPREAARQAASEAPAISVRETAQPAEPASVIPQRVPSQPYQSIIEPSYQAPAPAPVYLGYESEEVLREVAAAAQHRPDDPPVQFYSPSFSNFPAPTPRPRVGEPPSLDQPFAGLATRPSDYATPWRPTFSSGASRFRGERVSRLAELLYRMGVPSDLVRDVEIMIVVFSLVVATAVALVVFHRQVGAGVQWLGQNLSSKSSEAVEKPVGVATEPVPSPDSTLSPLLQPPAGTQSSAPAAVKRKPKPPVVVEGGMGAPTIYAADPNPTTPALPNDTGEAELASALPYLRGDSGSTETNVGVKWLWASVEKGNTKAAIMLADLYIWGRGVPQNCDQARVLLTAAVRRGNAEAAQRLQDMESDGCAIGATAPSR